MTEMPREGEVENKVFNQFFSRFAFKKLGDIDFCIVKPLDRYEGQQKELFSLDSPPQSSLIYGLRLNVAKNQIYMNQLSN